jgi:hypothetical protein
MADALVCCEDREQKHSAAGQWRVGGAVMRTVCIPILVRCSTSSSRIHRPQLHLCF